jgi:ubiquinone/menaquinone biosynthesis C-methylase UbiE
MTSSVVNFDLLADAYSAFRSGYSEPLIDQVMLYGSLAGRPVLDVGCGTGIVTAALAAKGVVTTGLDPSAAMLAHARASVPNVRFQEGTGEAIPFADGTFRAAVCAQAMHWMDAPKALAEMTRVTQPGGIVAVWWKVLASDDRIRTLRATAANAIGAKATKDPLPPGFSAFYDAPFARRELRVFPHMVRPTVAEWVGYESSRANALRAYGEKRDAYLTALREAMTNALGSPEQRILVRYMQYLYVGFVG